MMKCCFLMRGNHRENRRATMTPSSSKYLPQEDQGDQREETEVALAPELIISMEGMSAHTEGSEFFTADVTRCNNSEESSLFVTPSSSELYFSPRIHNMMEHRSEFTTDLEAEIEASKDHWTEVGFLDDQESIAERNLNVFRGLQSQYHGFGFFKEWDDTKMRLGRKIAEGGQAEIFELEGDLGMDGSFLLKMFKEGASLQDLRKQWPLDGMFRVLTMQGPLRDWYQPHNTGAMYGGVLLKNGRFAFMMRKYWGDLRKLIDIKMQHNRNRGPPFPEVVAERCMFDIANGMQGLHQSGVAHRDLKSSNILIDPDRYYEFLKQEDFDPIHGDSFICKVADYESSIGIVGTGFWRAPEILLGLQSGDLKPDLFTQKSDVYSYAMTCYEILTGRMPFEGFRFSHYDVVLSGTRPELPKIVKPWLKEMLSSCWHQDLSARPTFEEILNIFVVNVHRVEVFSGYVHGHTTFTWRDDANTYPIWENDYDTDVMDQLPITEENGLDYYMEDYPSDYFAFDYR